MATIAYTSYFASKYPIPLTSRISLDAKFKFVREHINADEVDTLIIGSSLALDNIQGEYLEKSSKKINSVLNLSANGATTLQAEQLMSMSDAFPNLKRIIYSTQYSDFPHRRKKYIDFKPKLFMKYMRDELNILEYTFLNLKACRDISFCFDRQKKWAEEHEQDNLFSYLGFDSTGSVSLNIYDDDIIGHRWRKPHPGIMAPESFQALDRMSHRANAKGIKFYLVQQPYREGLAKRSKVRSALAHFANRCKPIVEQHDGVFISLHDRLGLSDDYFADRSHLNDKGSMVGSKFLGELIDKIEK